MNRREAISTLSRGAALGAIAGTAVVAVSCQPIAAPAAVHDPMLDHIARCREVIRQVDTITGRSDEALDIACAPLDALYEELELNTPVVTTDEGAIEALRFCHWIYEDTAEAFIGPVMGAVLAYFDGRTA